MTLPGRSLVAVTALGAVFSLATVGSGASGSNARIAPVFPFCAWPVESTPALANEEGPDPNATYWTTPYLHTADYTSITIRGRYPAARFIAFTVYNNGGDDFTETVDGKTVPSQLDDYQLRPDTGSTNPWQVSESSSASRGRFTVRIKRNVTGAQQARLNAIPMVDTGAVLQNPIAPSSIGFFTFRTYIPSGGNTTVELPQVTITRKVRVSNPAYAGSARTKSVSYTLPNCNAKRIARAEKESKRLKQIIDRIDGNEEPGDVVKPCAVNGQPRYTNGCPPPLTWHQSSSEQTGALFPNTANAYIANWFQPAAGTVVITRGLMPATPRAAGSGKPGDSIGATAVNWLANPLPYQLRYWSVNNYLIKEPYPVVTEGIGPNRAYGGVADYQTNVDSEGYYTVVSSLPDDKPSSSSLSANAATWIPMQGDQPAVAETQWMRNMLGNFPYDVQAVPAAASPTDFVPAATVQQAMGPYYPQSAQCEVSTFESGGWQACLAASQAAS